MSTGPFKASWHRSGPPVEQIDTGSFGKKDFFDGWKVCYQSEDGLNYAIPMVFARKKDADLAARAVNTMSEWPSNVESAVDHLVNVIGFARLRKTMVEAMAW